MRPTARAPKEVAGLVAAGLVLASAPVLPQAPPGFGSEAELVTVDVVVLGPDGKPVPGLKREDFRILEDGRPQTVTAFEAVEAVVPALLEPETAPSAPSIARVATNVSAPPTRRTFAIVFDDLHVGDLDVEQARRAVRAFLDRDVRAGDRLVLLTTASRCASRRTFLTRIAMEPGDHRARLVVESGGKVGSVTSDFIVPDFTEERLSTPILSDPLVVGPGARRVMPVVRRSFPARNTLHAWLELHGAAADAETGQPRATAAFVVRSADGREWASGGPTAMNVEAGKPTRLVSLPLAEAPPGENEIVLTVRDEVSYRTFEVREPFRVEPSG